MRYLIDGSNCLGRLPGFRLGDPDSAQSFLDTLRSYAATHRSDEFNVYFDGGAGQTAPVTPLTVRFARPGQTVDEIIRALVRRKGPAAAASYRVVTDDRDLARRCQRAGAGVSTTHAFWRQVTRSVARQARKPPQPQPSQGSVEDGGLSPAEVAEWERYFAGAPKGR